ncbi:ferric reductase-like transmembrane domain-containing protein [Cryptosporangium phraense]|uniref:ferredoxin reductase family protein n=1 Tax=Cryptosporangium phraense TaxID=2593070 RepID=UPI00197AE2F4|nr:ferric reductase-like transmembrane domain-containing protein [Cryptosporangium phraense]
MTETVHARPAAPPRPRTPLWWGDSAVTAVGLSLLVVVALWVSHGGATQLSSGHWAAVSAGGRLAGLLASDLMLVQVLLLARIPLVERAFGQDRLARWHRWTGFASFDLMLVHIVLITLGYAGPVHTPVLREFWDLVTTYPGMLLAAAGSGFLVLVVVTSVRAARRRLRYESWHLLHLYAYLGVGLALPHQLWTGDDFIASPWARAYWWTLYAAAAAAVLVFRIGVPVWRSWRHDLRVVDVVPEGPGLTSVYLRGTHMDRLPVRAGQFFQWRFLDGPGWSRAHPYSLSSAPGRDDLLRITVKDLGDGSARVSTLRPGTRALIEGPYGRLTAETYPGGPVLLLASGVGITPLLALLQELPYGPGEATLVYRARTEADLAFRAELDTLATERGVRIVPLVGPRAAAGSWLPAGYPELTDAEALRALAPEVERHQLYVCGPEGWTHAVRAAAHAAGVPGGSIHIEQFAW